jgi:hypothetical protein
VVTVKFLAYLKVALITAFCINTISALLCRDVSVFLMGMRFIAVLHIVSASFHALYVKVKSIEIAILISFVCVIFWTQYKLPVWLLIIPAIICYRQTLIALANMVRAISLSDIGLSIGVAIAILSIRQFTTPKVGLLRYTLNQHTDTVHHAAFSEMIGNYGVVSTGMNGLVETPYHVLSHRLVYILSRLALTDSFTAYPYVLILIYLPLLAVLTSRLVGNTSIAKSSFVFISLVLVSVKLFRGAFISDVFLSSESQVLSIIVLVVYLSQQESNPIKQMSTGLVAMSLSLLTTLAKGPIGPILWCTEVVRSFITVRKATLGHLFILFIGGLLLGIAVIYPSIGNSGIIRVGFVPFVNRISTDMSWMQLTAKVLNEASARQLYTIEYFLGHYLLSVGLLVYGLFRRHNMKSRLWISLIVSTLVGLIVDLFLDLGGPNNYWITCIQFFIAIVILSSKIVMHRLSNQYVMVGIGLLVGLLGVPNFRIKIQERTLQPDSRIESVLKVAEKTRASNGTIIRDDIGLAGSLSKVGTDWKTVGLYFPAYSGRPWTNVVTDVPDENYHGWSYDFYQVATPVIQDAQLNRNLRGLSVTKASEIQIQFDRSKK